MWKVCETKCFVKTKTGLSFGTIAYVVPTPSSTSWCAQITASLWFVVNSTFNILNMVRLKCFIYRCTKIYLSWIWHFGLNLLILNNLIMHTTSLGKWTKKVNKGDIWSEESRNFNKLKLFIHISAVRKLYVYYLRMVLVFIKYDILQP